MKQLITILLFFTAISCQAQTQPDGATVNRMKVIRMPKSQFPNYTTLANTCQALLWLPDDYNKPGNENKHYPLYIYLHGSGEGGSIDIARLADNSIPKQIKEGFNPYSLVRTNWVNLNEDTVKWIIVAPHDAGNNYSFSWKHVRWMIPKIQGDYRVDSTLMGVGGISAGGRGAWSFPGEDSALCRKLAFIQPMSAVGYELLKPVMFNESIAKGLAVFNSVGAADRLYNTNNGYNTMILAVPPVPGKYFFYKVPGADHNGDGWNPATLRSTTWFGGKCFWDTVVNLRRTYTAVLTADAGVDRTITLPTSSISITGSGVPVSGTTITAYSWSRISGPNTPTLSGSSTATLTIGATGTAMIAGVYVYRLTVTSSAATTATDDVQITVNPATPENIPPVANAGSTMLVTPPATSTTLVGAGTDADGTIASYLWAKISGPTGGTIVTESSSTTNITSLTNPGTYTYRLRVTDNQGATGDDTVEIIVSTPTSPKIAFAIPAEYINTYVTKSDSSWYGMYFDYSLKRTIMTKYQINGRKIVSGYGGLYRVLAVDDQGYCWLANNDNNVCERIDTDSAGNAFSGIKNVCAFNATFMAIRPDGTIWYWGTDNYKMFSSSEATVITKPLKLPGHPDVTFKKVLTSADRIIALTTEGDLYEWMAGTSAPAKKIISPGLYVIDFAASYQNYFIAIMASSVSATEGYPWGWGNGWMLGLSAGTFHIPANLTGTWGLTQPIKFIVANQNTTHFITSDGKLWGMGDNSQGEVGNGWEAVNKADLVTNQYIWDWQRGKNMVSVPVHIAPWATFKSIHSGNSSTFYHNAIGTNDSIYFWGRGKSKVSGMAPMSGSESAFPNFRDYLAPTSFDPFKTIFDNRVFVKNTITLPTSQVTSNSSITLTGTATPSTFHTIASYAWTKVSGPSCTIVSPSSASTNVTGMSTGTYVFQLRMTDDNTGRISATTVVQVTGTPNQAPVANAGSDKTVNLPINTVTITGSGTDNDGSIVSYAWSKVSGPAGGDIVNQNSAETVINNLPAGEHVFRLTVTDNQGATGTDDVKITAVAEPLEQTILRVLKSIKWRTIPE